MYVYRFTATLWKEKYVKGKHTIHKSFNCGNLAESFGCFLEFITNNHGDITNMVIEGVTRYGRGVRKVYRGPRARDPEREHGRDFNVR